MEVVGGVAACLDIAVGAFKTARALKKAFVAVREVVSNHNWLEARVDLIEVTLAQLCAELDGRKRRGESSLLQRVRYEKLEKILNSCESELNELRKATQKDMEQMEIARRRNDAGRINIRNISWALDKYMQDDAATSRRLGEILVMLQACMHILTAGITWNMPRQLEDIQETTQQALRQLATQVETFARKAGGLPDNSPVFLHLDDDTDDETLHAASVDGNEKDIRHAQVVRELRDSAFDDIVHVMTSQMGRTACPEKELELAREDVEVDPSGDPLVRSRTQDLISWYNVTHRKVKQLESVEFFTEAAICQKKCIRYRDELDRAGNLSLPPEERADMEEKLSDLLFCSGISRYIADAIRVLERLDERLKASPEENMARRLKNLHKIGKYCLRPDIDEPSRAFECLEMAITGHRGQQPRDAEKINEIYQLYYRAGHMSNNRRRVDTMEFELQMEMRSAFRGVDHRYSVALEWCKGKGFRFDESEAQVTFNYLRNDKGDSPFHVAAQDKGISEEVLRSLLSKQDTLDDTNGNELTALFIAIDESHRLAVRLLLDYGASLDIRDRNNRTVLHRLGSCQDEMIIDDVFRKLTSRRVATTEESMIGPTDIPLDVEDGSATHDQLGLIDVNQLAEFERTPLHYAASLGNYPLVSRLLLAGAVADVVDLTQRSPLLDACLSKAEVEVKKAIIKQLVKYHADPKKKDIHQYSPEKELRRIMTKSEAASLLYPKDNNSLRDETRPRGFSLSLRLRERRWTA